MAENIESIEYISFLVRFWHEWNIPIKASGWRGEVENIQTGKNWKFENVNDLLYFLREQLNATVSVDEGD